MFVDSRSFHNHVGTALSLGSTPRYLVELIKLCASRRRYGSTLYNDEVSTFWSPGVGKVSEQRYPFTKLGFARRAHTSIAYVHAYVITKTMRDTEVRGQRLGGSKGGFGLHTQTTNMHIACISCRHRAVEARLREKHFVADVTPTVMKDDMQPCIHVRRHNRNMKTTDSNE